MYGQFGISFNMFIKKLLVFAAAAVFALIPCCTGGREPAGSALLYVRVLEGFTGEPVTGAAVTVPEAGLTCLTGTDGMTDGMPVPVIPDAEYEALLPSGTGRATVLVTAPGFTPCLLLYARTEPNEARTVELLLFPDDGSLPVFTMVESPDNDWCLRLAQKYAPQAE